MFNTISPGIFIKEIDQSFFQAAALAAGNCLIGPTNKGPAFLPITVQNQTQFEQIFGTFEADKYLLPKAAELILKNSDSLTVVRTLGSIDSDVDENLTAGFVLEKATFLSIVSGSVNHIMAVLWHDDAVSFSASADVLTSFTGAASTFDLTITGGVETVETLEVSFNPSSQFFISKILNTDLSKFRKEGYVLKGVNSWDYFKNNFVDLIASSSGTMSVSEAAVESSGQGYDVAYKTPQTPWFYSQKFGIKDYKLFKLWALSDGESANTDIKITVQNLNKAINEDVSKYGSFTLSVRKFSDTDKNPVTLESFSSLNFDPESENYILNRVGDRYFEFDSNERKLKTKGSSNVSKYIRVSLSNDLLNGNVPQEALPFGFGKPPVIDSNKLEPGRALVRKQFVKGYYNAKKCWGINFEGRLSDSVSGETIAPYKHDSSLQNLTEYVPEMFNPLTDDVSWFSLNYLSGSFVATSDKFSSSELRKLSYDSEATETWATVDNLAGTSAAKFTMFFYGGFDGLNPFVKSCFYTYYTIDDVDSIILNSCLGYLDQGPVLETTTYGLQTVDLVVAGSTEINSFLYSIRKAVDIVADPDFVDINLIAIPGITNQYLNNYLMTKCEERGDALAIVDMAELYTPSLTPDAVMVLDSVVDVRDALGYDSSYGATYYPYFKIYDQKTKQYCWVPPSLAVLRSIALTDKMAFAWFAPAGFIRGGIPEATEVFTRLNFEEREELYKKGINPIAQFPNEGIVIYGQKTLQSKESLLNRVNVRRLVIRAKKAISGAVKVLLWEQNNIKTWQRFVDLVQPILTEIKNQQGLSSFVIKADSTTTTADLLEKNIMRGTIIIQPTPALERIEIGFIISNQTATFEV